MVYNVADNTAEFGKAKMKNFPLKLTASGHPAIAVEPSACPFDGSLQAWENSEIKITPSRGQYTAFMVQVQEPSSLPVAAPERRQQP